MEALSPLDARTTGLLRALSHELRNPLTTVLGYLELLTDGALGPLTEEQQRVLSLVAGAMSELVDVVEDLEAAPGRTMR